MSYTNNSIFIPRRAASWWCSLEDILWPEKKIIDKIKFKAERFAEANIDTAINFGFHIRFDFSNYFSQLHGYYAAVCEELHKYNIRFMDHYSCNHVQRPKNFEEFKKVHKNHRHHILLFHDPVAAQFAQYEGHFFNDICEIDIRNGEKGYSNNYQLSVFCHNNPGFIDMHKKYLKRLLNDVPMDAIDVDDMCDYAGLATCGCKYCRDRFKRDYGHEIPPFDNVDFWGVTEGKNEFSWGNYDNPVFRDWLRMKSDSIAEHVSIIKDTIGDIPLMTCCSSSGPIQLNAVSLNLERMSPSLDFLMLENCGISVNSTNWVRMDAEAYHQKDMAEKMGNAPTIAISYSIYKDSAYLGWALSRFWGVGNWSSTLNQRLEKDPDDAYEIYDLVKYQNLWEAKNSDLSHIGSRDFVEVRLVSNKFCRENGWKDTNGHEHWDKVLEWSKAFVKNSIGYRFVRADELADIDELCKTNTPLVLDGIGCLSQSQFDAINAYLKQGGAAWISLPFGTHDELGVKRETPLSSLLDKELSNLYIISSITDDNPLKSLIVDGIFKPAITLISGNPQWAARIRSHNGKKAIHLINTSLEGIPHDYLKNNQGNPVLEKINFDNSDSNLVFRINEAAISPNDYTLMSPELHSERRTVELKQNKRCYDFHFDLSGVGVYAVVQESSL